MCISKMRSLHPWGRTCKRRLICISLRFSSRQFLLCPLRSSCQRRNEHQHRKHRLHLRSKHGTLHPPFFHLLVLANIFAPYPRSAGQCWRCCQLCCPKKSLLQHAGASNLFQVTVHLQARTRSTSASTNAQFLTPFPSVISASRHHSPD